jgi:hypothetical protein
LHLCFSRVAHGRQSGLWAHHLLHMQLIPQESILIWCLHTSSMFQPMIWESPVRPHSMTFAILRQ